MSRLAPTSTPRVGSSSTITRGSGCSTLASASFCWLPPDSDDAAASQRAGADAEVGDRLLQRRALGAPVEQRTRVAVERPSA